MCANMITSAHAHTHTHTHTHARTHTYTHACAHTHTHTHAYARTHTRAGRPMVPQLLGQRGAVATVGLCVLRRVPRCSVHRSRPGFSFVRGTPVPHAAGARACACCELEL